MKKTCLLIVLLALPVWLTGCFTTDLTAPPGHEVRIMAKDEPASFRKEYKDFYLFWGILPIWRTKPEEIIAKENLVTVRAQTQDTVSDAFISILTSFILFPQTIVVEGNRATTTGPERPD